MFSSKGAATGTEARKKKKKMAYLIGPSPGKKRRFKMKHQCDLVSEGKEQKVMEEGEADGDAQLIDSKEEEDGEEDFSAGIVLCSDPIEDEDMVNYNFRSWENMESNIGMKTWNAISNLGFVSRGTTRDYRRKIEEMKKRDKANLPRKKELQIGLQ